MATGRNQPCAVMPGSTGATGTGPYCSVMSVGTAVAAAGRMATASAPIVWRSGGRGDRDRGGPSSEVGGHGHVGDDLRPLGCAAASANASASVAGLVGGDHGAVARRGERSQLGLPGPTRYRSATASTYVGHAA